MKYILDFDRTVFDMEALYKKIATHNPNTQTGTLESLEGIELSELLFRDAIDFFLQTEREAVEIVSSCYGKTGQWDIEYQKEKVRRSCVNKYVNSVHVVLLDKVEAISSMMGNETVVFVDDHPEHLAKVSAELPEVKVVYLDRLKEYAADKEIPRIELLTDLVTITTP